MGLHRADTAGVGLEVEGRFAASARVGGAGSAEVVGDADEDGPQVQVEGLSGKPRSVAPISFQNALPLIV